MCTLFFSARRYIAQTATQQLSNFVLVVQKRLGMNKFVRKKVLQEVNFPKSFFEQFYTRWIVIVHLCCGFSLWRQMASQESAKFRTAFFFGQFRASLRKDSVANYASIWTVFSSMPHDPRLSRDFTSALTGASLISQIVGKLASEEVILQLVKTNVSQFYSTYSSVIKAKIDFAVARF